MIRRITVFVLAVFSAAPTVGMAMAAEENQYAQVGRWGIWAHGYGNGFVYCAAESDNGQVAVRIATNGQAWQIAVPYYESGSVQGGIGFAGIQEWVQFSGGDGWAATNIQPNGLAELKRQQWLYIQLDRGLQKFSLQGSSAALKKAAECAANQGYT